jgi:hypothetical protein
MAQVELHYLVDKTERKYIGRFLGFIKDDEFNAICQSKKAASKIESKETKPLIEVCKMHDTLKGYRLILVIKKIDGTSVNMDKKLFVSERLNYISLVSTQEKRAVFVSENDNNFVVQEIE